jgi:DNA-binding response OmpR family regulator
VDRAVRTLSSDDIGFAPVLIDLALSQVDMLRACGRLRKATDAPIILIDVGADAESRIRGLEAGADDCLARPYKLRELVARIYALSRHQLRLGAVSACLSYPEPAIRYLFSADRRLLVDPRAREVAVDGATIALTRKEFDLLFLLSTNPGVAVSRERIIFEVWNEGAVYANHTLSVHVASLRGKLGVPGLIETVRGVGYRLAAAA